MSQNFRLWFWSLVLIFFALHRIEAKGNNVLLCSVQDKTVLCDIDVRDFFSHEIRNILNNGWENLLRFRLYLLDQDGEVITVTYGELNQRCYIDPFEDLPCLAVWRGDSQGVQSYVDLDSLIESVGHFRLRSASLSDLEAGIYRAKLQVELNPITDEQIHLIRAWLARNRGGHLVIGHGDQSMFGMFVSVFANITPGSAEATLTLDSNPISISVKP